MKRTIKYFFYIKLYLSNLLLLPIFSSAQSIDPDSIITKKSLETTVSFLASDSLKGRLSGSKGAAVAAGYIAERFRQIGLNMAEGFEGFFYTTQYAYRGNNINITDVLGVLPPDVPNDSIMIISAHYDHVGSGNDLSYNYGYNCSDNIFNGANDNASGVAVMLELAKYYKLSHANRYTLLFVAFSGEELGMIGSGALSIRLKNNLLKGVINIEMMGRPTHDHCYVIGKYEDYIAQEFNRALKGNKKRMPDYFMSDPYPWEGLIRRSDHYSFMDDVEICFTLMSTPPDDRFYHTVKDEPQTIMFDEMQKATVKIAKATEGFMKK